ncbi:SPT3 Dosage dependent suppressor of Ty-induced promoter mutations-like protein [Basidiobolus ranarum]|uniref:SPT3 Dosage dependent suppressor of Ty-induced promoter mutations-like protein n=1 Tax=Basidiobolus ranarum TaxID=34480 RepID=A0ABR2WR10_9FUNG
MTSNSDLMNLIEQDRINIKAEPPSHEVSPEEIDSPFFSAVTSTVGSPRDADNFIIDYLLPQSDDDSLFLNPKLEALDAESTLFFTTSHPHSPLEGTTPAASPPIPTDHNILSPSIIALSSPPSPLSHSQQASLQRKYSSETHPPLQTVSFRDIISKQTDDGKEIKHEAVMTTSNESEDAMSDLPDSLSLYSQLFGTLNQTVYPQSAPALAQKCLNFSDYLNRRISPISNPLEKYDDHLSDGDISGKGLQIRVLGVPQTGAKSRVETQIKLCLQLVTDKGEKVPLWSHLRLPEYMVAKEKLKRKNSRDQTLPIVDRGILNLEATVICASEAPKKVLTCLGCVQRERKRAQRKKENRLKNQQNNANKHMVGDVNQQSNSMMESNKPTAMDLDDEKSLQLEQRKILLFNCNELVDFSSGDTILPTRITCYCRHHNEKVGFCICFVMKDYTGQVIATGMSPPIMITDDHKSSKFKSNRKLRKAEYDRALKAANVDSPLSTPSAIPSPAPTPITMSPSLVTALSTPQQISPPVSPTNLTSLSSSSSHHLNLTSVQSRLNLPRLTAQEIQNQFLKSITTFGQDAANDNDVSKLEEALSIDGATAESVEAQLLSIRSRPRLSRVVPAEGPMYGGVEITVLGSDFHDGLTCLFGSTPANGTHYWSSNTLVCILPPSPSPGPVVVSFKEYQFDSACEDSVVLFTYIDETDRALMELALQVIGLKTTGKLEDARQVAMRIIAGDSNSDKDSGSSGGKTHHSRNHDLKELESLIIDCFMELDSSISGNQTSWTLKNETQHTLLHLAALSGLEALSEFLIEKGIDVDCQDTNGYTALHFAAWTGRRSIVECLTRAQASTTLETKNQLTAMDLARDQSRGEIVALLEESTRLSSSIPLDVSHSNILHGPISEIQTGYSESPNIIGNAPSKMLQSINPIALYQTILWRYLASLLIHSRGQIQANNLSLWLLKSF